MPPLVESMTPYGGRRACVSDTLLNELFHPHVAFFSAVLVLAQAQESVKGGKVNIDE